MNKHSSSKGRKPYNLFQPAGSANWSVRFSIRGQGQIRKSLGTPDVHRAEIKAQRIYYETLYKAGEGLNVKISTISKIIAEFVADMETKAAQGFMPKNVASQNKAILERYVDGFFGPHNPNFISTRTIDQYLSWRSDYWITGPGKDIAYLTYERAGKAITTPVTAKKRVRPSPATLNRERAALAAFLRYCFDSQYIKAIPEIRTVKTGYTARPGFSQKEFEAFAAYARASSQEEGLHPAVFYDRWLFFPYVSFIALSGMRPTEVKNMKWGDVIGLEIDKDGNPQETDIHLRVYGKGRSRELIPREELAFGIRMLYKFYRDEAGIIPEKDDFLFMHKDRTQFKSFTGQFNRALAATDLTKDYRGVKRTPYSLRHYYITEQLRRGVDAYILARNVGTSVKMLEEHYDHNTNERYKEMLRPKRI